MVNAGGGESLRHRTCASNVESPSSVSHVSGLKGSWVVGLEKPLCVRTLKSCCKSV